MHVVHHFLGNPVKKKLTFLYLFPLKKNTTNQTVNYYPLRPLRYPQCDHSDCSVPVSFGTGLKIWTVGYYKGWSLLLSDC